MLAFMDSALIHILWEKFFESFIEHNISATYFAIIERNIPISEAIASHSVLSNEINQRRLPNQKVPSNFLSQYTDRYLSNVDRLINQADLFRVDEMIRFEGNFEAYKFAIECDANSTQITQELNHHIEILKDSIHRPEYQPIGGPRIFIDAYIQTLQDILQIIDAEQKSKMRP